ncbi:unnamed protein product, partial [Discosporangium mesarthrocarpum]
MRPNGIPGTPPQGHSDLSSARAALLTQSGWDNVRGRGGVRGVALPTWRQLQVQVQGLVRQLLWAEGAAQRAADGRLHVSSES